VFRFAARDAAGNAAERVERLGIEQAPLPRQALVVPAALAPLATGPVATAEASQLAELTSAVRPERLWSGPFRQPLAAPAARTTGFGDRRDYADGHVVYHGGYDLAAPDGTPVLAVANGIVVFAGALPQRGNTVVLDHGWGIYSVYAHLRLPPGQAGTQLGQAVSQGQAVGAVGSTGLSTGPHLHWEIRLRGQAIDPGGWLALSQDLP
jgi:murein DD-endopeptidase MepM/ murein hydrolase activator NlpD